MALTDDTNTTMLVSPTGGSGFGDMGNGWWIILLFILLGGWGNGFNGGGIMPDVQSGFNQSAVMSGINGINSQLSGVQAAISNGFAQAEIADNARQIADMQNTFNAQTAVTQGMNTIAMNLQNCCCENRANVADLKYTVATENCADRQALNEGVRDIIANNNAQTQAILDRLSALEMDAYKRENEQLRTQLNMANLSASQTAQTAQLIQDNTVQTMQLINRLAPTPIPAYVVDNPTTTTSGT